MHVLLGTSQGRTVETVVPLPTIEVLSPSGTFSIPFDDDVAGDIGRLTTELAARTEPGNTVEVNGERVEVDREGRFATDITVQPGENHYGIVARNPMGVLRVANLKRLMDDADTPLSEKYRRVMEAYQVEVQYGHTIEAYQGELRDPGSSRMVEFLRLGRVGLYYLSLDGKRWIATEPKFLMYHGGLKKRWKYKDYADGAKTSYMTLKLYTFLWLLEPASTSV